MKKISTLILLLLFSITTIKAQWVQKAPLPGPARAFAATFTINNKIYLYGGFDSFNNYDDLWEYDISNNTWTQKSSLGLSLSEPASFAIGGKGYVASGVGSLSSIIIYEYDPSMDLWSVKGPFPQQSRYNTTGFSIGNKGYITSGVDFSNGGNSTSFFTLNDLLEYDPVANTLTPKASLPAPTREFPLGISVGNKGYVGLGNDVAANGTEQPNYNDFYSYDQANDTWTQLANFPGTPVSDMGCFAIGQKIYVVGGVNFPSIAFNSNCWVYDIPTNIWTQLTNFPGGVIASCTGGANATKGYLGTGYNSNFTERIDWWEFTPALPTGMAEEESIKSLTIYPVPFKDVLTIKGDLNQIKQVKIYDATGKEVLSVSELKNKTLLTDELPLGLYTINVYWAGGEISHKKVVKN